MSSGRQGEPPDVEPAVGAAEFEPGRDAEEPPVGARRSSDAVREAAHLDLLREHLAAKHGMYNDEARSLDWPTLIQEHGEQHEVGHSHLHQGLPDFFADYRSPLAFDEDDEPEDAGREATAWKCWGCGGPDPADCEPDCPAWVEAMGDD